MKEYDATEAAFNNGYEKGRIAGINELASRLKKYYSNLNGETVGVSVAYFVDVVSKELERSNDT
jgi:hypothetical protein